MMLGGGDEARETSPENCDALGVEGRLGDGLANESILLNALACEANGNVMDRSVAAELGTFSVGRIVLVVTRIVNGRFADGLETCDVVVVGVAGREDAVSGVATSVLMSRGVIKSAAFARVGVAGRGSIFSGSFEDLLGNVFVLGLLLESFSSGS